MPSYLPPLFGSVIPSLAPAIPMPPPIPPPFLHLHPPPGRQSSAPSLVFLNSLPARCPIRLDQTLVQPRDLNPRRCCCFRQHDPCSLSPAILIPVLVSLPTYSNLCTCTCALTNTSFTPHTTTSGGGKAVRNRSCPSGYWCRVVHMS